MGLVNRRLPASAHSTQKSHRNDLLLHNYYTYPNIRSSSLK
jgi:hypothetical protein